ncbi:hypothetical protein HPB47_018966 [Ixodes persulcatus]|uniref:Uncharacterized protein n=1 Tax=Ixodes persulcatus TaxID=34615 RepID=A0AC60QKA5_IXOPE|nr:hypothetical protein HPB47_018966 [Ixodes persulcatus]
MSTGRPDFGPLNTLADVATRGQPLPAPRSPRIAQATVPLGGQRLSPTSASGLYSEVPTSAEDPLTTSPSREPIQVEPIPGTVPSPEGYAAGDVSGPLGGHSAPPVPQRYSVSARAGLLHDRATSASPLRESPPAWPLLDVHPPLHRGTAGELRGPPYGHAAHLLPRLDTATQGLGTPRDGLLPPSRGSLPARDIDAAPARATAVGNLIDLTTDGADRLPNGVSGVSLLRDESPALRVPTPICSGDGQQSSHDALLQDASRIIESLSGAMHPPWKPRLLGLGRPRSPPQSTRHVATWTWQQGTGPPHGFVSWRGWSEQRRPRPGVPGDKMPPLFRGRTVQDANREAQGASMTPDPAAVYCEGCGVLRINEIPDVSKLHRSRVRVPEVVPPPAPPDLHAALDQPGAVDAVLSYMARRPEFAAAILDGSRFRMPVDVAMDGVSGEAAPSAPALSPEEERQLTEEILQF